MFRSRSTNWRLSYWSGSRTDTSDLRPCTWDSFVGARRSPSYAAACYLQVERRTIPGETAEMVEAEIEQILEGLRRENPEFSAMLTTGIVRNPFEVAEDAEIVDILGQAVKSIRENHPVSSAKLVGPTRRCCPKPGCQRPTLALPGLARTVLKSGLISTRSKRFWRSSPKPPLTSARPVIPCPVTKTGPGAYPGPVDTLLPGPARPNC